MKYAKYAPARSFAVRILCVASLMPLMVAGVALAADAATVGGGVTTVTATKTLDPIGDTVGGATSRLITVNPPNTSTPDTPGTGVDQGVGKGGTGAGPGAETGTGSGRGSGTGVGVGIGTGTGSVRGPTGDDGTDPRSGSATGSEPATGSETTVGSGTATGAATGLGSTTGAGSRMDRKSKAAKAKHAKQHEVPGTVVQIGLTAGDSADGDENGNSSDVQSGQISAQLMAAASTFGWSNVGILTLLTALWGAWQVFKYRRQSDRRAGNPNATFLKALPESERAPTFNELISR